MTKCPITFGHRLGDTGEIVVPYKAKYTKMATILCQVRTNQKMKNDFHKTQVIYFQWKQRTVVHLVARVEKIKSKTQAMN